MFAMQRVPAPALPLPLTPILGRAAELEETERLLRSNRLLTITGAGGSGKTRLALELAHRSCGEACESVWIDLAVITDPELIGEHILASLGRQDQHADDVLQAVIEAIGGRRMLLVLDNCEHLVARVAVFTEQILRYCPEAAILATSREALGVAGEQTWLVPPLSAAAAAELFFDRARAVNSAFAPDAATAEVVGQICARLDGIPLAIELAAARVRALSVSEIAARLDDAFHLLSSGSRNLPRHRTIHETIDWSYRLLSGDEQRLLQRLSVFIGSFSLDAVERVCGDPSLDVLTTLTSLIDKSLVIAERGAPAGYRLLDTVRQFATARWTDAGERTRTAKKHAAYSVSLFEALAPRLYGGAGDPDAMAVVDGEIGNIRALLDRGIERDVQARLLYALAWYGFARGHFSEARKRLDAIDVDDDAASESGALLQLSGAITAAGEGDWDRVRELAARAIDPFRTAELHQPLATARSLLGAALAFGNEDRASIERLFAEAARNAEIAADDRIRSFVFYWRGIALRDAEDFKRSADAASNAGAAALQARALTGLAELELAAGDPEAADRTLLAAIELFSTAQDAWGATTAIEAVAWRLCSPHADETGARLLAGASAARLRLGSRAPRFPATESELETTICNAMRDDRLRTMVASGAVMSDEALLQLAREELTRRLARREPPLRVRALGHIEIERDGVKVDESPRARELLLYLLCHPTGRTKEQIGAALWPDAEPAKIRNNFHVTLHRLRRTLGGSEWILIDGDTYVLDRSRGLEADFETFEREVTAALRTMQQARLAHAVDLYRGDFAEDASSEWQRPFRERLRELYAKSLAALAKAQTSAGDHTGAAATWERAVTLDELEENVAANLIDSLRRAGDAAGAKRAWRRLANALDRELGVEPSIPMP